MNKQLFVEYSQVRLTKVKTEASEAAGKTAEGIWEAPVWKLGVVNLNGRVYNHALADRIVAEATVTGCCDGHEPDRSEEFKNNVAICKEPYIKDGEMWVRIYMIDKEYESMLAKSQDLGLLIGVSSVGYGETDENGVVNPLTYELVRYMDFVANPANPSAIAMQKNKKPEPEEPKAEEAPAGASEPSAPADEAMKRIERLKRYNQLIKSAGRTKR